MEGTGFSVMDVGCAYASHVRKNILQKLMLYFYYFFFDVNFTTGPVEIDLQ